MDEEKRLIYGVAAAEERDNTNEIFDYASSKPYIDAWATDFRAKTDGKSCGNLRAMHNAISAGKLTQLDFDDKKKAVNVCAKVIDAGEWEKVLQGVYTGFSFGGSAIRKWKDDKLNAVRYTLNPNELSLADKPCVPSAIFFEIVKTDGTTEQRQFKNTGGKNIVNEIKKNMDMTQFLELMNNVKEGLTADANTPENLTAAVDNLVNVLTECTGQQKAETAEAVPPTEQPEGAPKKEAEKAVESGCPTEKVDMAAEIKKAFAPLAKSLEGIAGATEAISKVTKSIDDIQKRIEKIENQPAPTKVVKTVSKSGDGAGDPPADSAAAALEEIKKAHNFQTCAY